MLREWQQPPQLDTPVELVRVVGGHPLVARLLAQRGFTDPDAALAFLEPERYKPMPPDALLGVAEAARILQQAIQNEQNILVWGDFDVDGQTSTSLLVSGLQALCKPEKIRFHVPNRFTESHGIKPQFLQPWIDDPHWQPQVLLTCDTGIAEAPAVEMAKDAGWTVVITDHHDLTPEFEGLSPGVDSIWGLNPLEFSRPSVRIADAIVNPKFLPVDDPLRTLPGVGVAYKLIQQLYIEAGIAGQEEDLLDLVALGIVADLAEQVNDARYLLQLGLDKLSNTQRTGLLALMEVARVTPGRISTDDIGFQIGPRMNALGRLEDATVAVELLTTNDAIRAGQLAAMMERLNQQRRLLTTQIASSALEMINRQPELLDYNGLVLTHPGWHAGIVGIVASRLVEEFNRPVVLLLNPPGEPARGSARSINGIDIGSSIAGCAHLLIGHGGHPGAAGLSLLPENIDAFRRELDRQIELNRTDDGPPLLPIDAELALDEINMDLVEELQRLAPFGNGNPPPNFMSKGVNIVNNRRIGREGNHRKFFIQQDEDGPQLPVLWFNSGDAELAPGPQDLVYTLSINEYRGEQSIQLMYVASRASQLDNIPFALETKPQLQIYDIRPTLRGTSLQAVELGDAELGDAELDGAERGDAGLQGTEPQETQNSVDTGASLDEQLAIPSQVEAVWYAEGRNLPEHVAYSPRHQLADAQARSVGSGNDPPNQSLVLWSIPPSAETLAWLVDTVSPLKIYLVGQSQVDDSLDGVLRNVAGMCKYVLSRQKQISLVNAASRLGTTTGVIRHSLRWLECKGLITLNEWISDDIVAIQAGIPGNGATTLSSNEREILQSELEEQLAEVRAYRRYFQRASIKEMGMG